MNVDGTFPAISDMLGHVDMADTIKKLTIEGFKSIRRLEDFPLRALNVLIGANGAGKSNFVSFFRLLRLLGPPGHKGGRPNYQRVKRDVLAQLKQKKGAYCSTMIDLYGLGDGFPGYPPPARLSNIEKVCHVEQSIRRDI